MAQRSLWARMGREVAGRRLLVASGCVVAATLVALLMLLGQCDSQVLIERAPAGRVEASSQDEAAPVIDTGAAKTGSGGQDDAAKAVQEATGAKTVTSPVMSAPAEAVWAPAAGVAGFVESEVPPHATSEAAETSESAVMARRRERRMGVLSVQCDCEAGSAGSRPGAGPPGLRPPVVPVRTGPDGAAAIVTGESGKNRVLGRHRARFRRSRAARRRIVICRPCEPHAILLQRSMTLKPNG